MTSQSATVLTQQPAAADVVFFLSALCWDCFRSAPGGGIAKKEREGAVSVGWSQITDLTVMLILPCRR